MTLFRVKIIQESRFGPRERPELWQLAEMFWIPRPLMNGTLLGAPTSFSGTAPDFARVAHSGSTGRIHFVECVQVAEAQNYTAEWTDLVRGRSSRMSFWSLLCAVSGATSS